MTSIMNCRLIKFVLNMNKKLRRLTVAAGITKGSDASYQTVARDWSPTVATAGTGSASRKIWKGE